MPRIIDLAHYRTAGVRVFAGRDRGETVRHQAGLHRLDTNNEMIEVKIPEDIFSINSSFFLGMFGDSIRHLGEDEFRRRYKFTGKDVSRVKEAGIREALKRRTPL